MQTKNLTGWALFIAGCILYSAEQSYSLFGFANIASQIIWIIICYALICGGIAMTVFSSNVGSQTLTGVMCVLITFLCLNALLLVYDGATGGYNYSSVDYFYLLINAFDLSLVGDPVAITLVVLSLPLGLAIWSAMSGSEMEFWYDVMLYAVVVLILCTLFPFLNKIYVFGIW